MWGMPARGLATGADARSRGARSTLRRSAFPHHPGRTVVVRLATLFAAVLACCAFWPQAVTAQTLEWSGEIRLRSEVDNRNFDLDTAPNYYTLSRTRLGARVGLHEHVSAFVQIQDSRQFGAAGNTLQPLDNLDLHQAFLDVRNVFADEIGLRAGRMQLAYGNERLIGAVGWHNVGRAFDGAVLDVSLGGTRIDLIATTIRETHPWAPVATPGATLPRPDDKQQFFGAYTRIAPTPPLAADVYVLWENHPPAESGGIRPLSRWTTGTYLRGGLAPGLAYQVEIAAQLGRRQGEDVGAYMLTGSLEQRLGATGMFAVAVGYDHLSGTPADGDRYGAFDPLFHTGHRFYGFMDYFVAVPANTGGRGLRDLYVRARMLNFRGLTLDAWLHNFWLDTPAADGGRFLGHELDLVASFRLHDTVSVEAGAAAYAGTDRMTSPFLGDDLAWWSYLSLRAGF